MQQQIYICSNEHQGQLQIKFSGNAYFTSTLLVLHVRLAF